MWSERSLRESYPGIYRQYTHTFTHAYLCADQPLNVTFFAALRIRKYMAPGGYSQSCDFRLYFRDKCGQKNSLRDSYIYRQYRGPTHTFTHICVQISYKRHFLRISMAPGGYSIRRAALRIASFITTSGKIFTMDKYYRDTGTGVLLARDSD